MDPDMAISKMQKHVLGITRLMNFFIVATDLDKFVQIIMFSNTTIVGNIHKRENFAASVVGSIFRDHSFFSSVQSNSSQFLFENPQISANPKSCKIKESTVMLAIITRCLQCCTRKDKQMTCKQKSHMSERFLDCVPHLVNILHYVTAVVKIKTFNVSCIMTS